MDRRRFLLGSAVGTAALASGLGLGACSQSAGVPGVGGAGLVTLDPVIEELQERSFRWFWDTTNAANGMTPDRWPTPSFASVAAIGDALACWPIGVERGWITREQARERTLTTIRFLHGLKQGPEPTGCGGYKGFFYHFIDMNTGHRFGQTELSSVDTALLMGGMMFAARWFDQDHADEAEIRRLTQVIYERIEWPWLEARPNRISMGWHPESGIIEADWNVYNEGMIVLILAMGSPTHPVSKGVWDEWCSVYDKSFTDRWGPKHLHFGPMFGHQYSHMFIDFRGIQDEWMRGQSGIPGFDYFENSKRAVLAQQKYGVDNPKGWDGYSGDIWGFTACDGPGDFKQVINGREREFFSYSARGPGEREDGTIAPTAAAGSICFEPEIVTNCIKAIKAQYGEHIYGQYGFLDSFNLTLKETENRLLHGKIVPGVGWFNGDYIGIDQGPIVIMTENLRSNIIWNRMHGEPNIVRGLKVAGFTGGWLDQA